MTLQNKSNTDLTGLDDGPPLPKHILKARRNMKIIDMRATGKSLRFIAEKFNMSHEGVRALLNKT